MYHRQVRGWALRALCISLLAFTALAQSERGTITGVVHDSSGAIVPGATVTIVNRSTNVTLTATTNEAGEYTMPSLQPGVYNVKVNKQGFRTSEESGLTLDAGQTVRADLALEVGVATQTVEVIASAVQLQTDDARFSTVLQNKMVNDLPMVVGGTVRTPFDLASVAPDAKNLGGDNGFMLGGGQAASYGTSLDGVSTNTSRALSKSWVASNSPSVEAIDQFSVDSNGYKADVGHAGGGNLTFVSKSGTNQLHGSAYEFLRNNDFDANNFFNNLGNIPRSIYKQNDFGFTVGGPVWIPKVINGKDKTFFFFSWGQFRQSLGYTLIETIPTQANLAGDFSANLTTKALGINPCDGSTIYQGQIFDPTTTNSNVSATNPTSVLCRTAFPGNKINIPMSSVAKAISAYIPAPATSGLVNNYNAAGIRPIIDTTDTIRIDHTFGAKDKIFGSYSVRDDVTT